MSTDELRAGQVVVVTSWPIVEDVLSSWLGAWWPVRRCGDPGATAIDAGCDDVIVIGPDVDEADGLSIINEIGRRARSIVLVSDANVGSEVRWMRSGASAILHMREFDREMFRRVLSDLSEGRHVVSEEAMRWVLRSDDGWDRLSARQREVASMLVHGASTRDVADHLNVAESTIKTHVARMCRTIGAPDKEGLLSALRIADDASGDPSTRMAHR